MTTTAPEPSDVGAALERRLARQERRRRWTRRGAIGAAAVVLVGATFLAVHVAVRSGARPVRVLGEPPFALPSPAAGCTGAVTLGDGAVRIPITFSRSGATAQMSVGVCLDGHGPYPFIIDTGAAFSAVDAPLAARLDLPEVGAPQRFAGVGCTGDEQLEELASWSMAGVPLAGQAVAVQAFPGMGGAREPMGLLGADVLSRFGAVRFDFVAGTLTVPGLEGAAPTGTSTVHGPLSVPLPPTLVSGQPKWVVGLDESLAPTYFVVATPVQFGDNDGTAEFGVDTGSSRSLVDASLNAVLKLARTDLAQAVTTVCSRITVPLVASRQWSIGAAGLAPSLIGSIDLGSLRRSGIDGLLGLDQLSRFEYAVLDFSGAQLALGPRIGLRTP